jgi:radical SAM superfamily enzyme YgiQ (UPF0313 family)
MWTDRVPSLGINSIAHSLMDNGHNVSIFDFNVKIPHHLTKLWYNGSLPFWASIDQYESIIFPQIKDYLNLEIDNIIKIIKEKDIKCVGISILCTTMFSATFIIQRIRHLDVKIMIGGREVSRNNSRDNDLLMGIIDAAVINEGEVSVPKLIKEWECGNEDFVIPGVNHVVNGVIRKTPPELIKDLSVLPIIDFRGQDLSYYKTKQDAVSLQMSRGCYGNCHFCSETGDYRHRKAESIFEEMKRISELHDINKFVCVDSVLFPKHREMKKLMKLIIESGKTFLFEGNCRIVPRLNVEDLLEMKKAGCYSLTFGVESGSQKVLDLMNKKTKVEWAENNLKNCKIVGIETAVNILVGFPGEDEKEFQETIDFLLKNKDNISRVNVGYGLTITKDTELYRNPQKFNIISKIGRDWETGDGKNTKEVRIERVLRLKEVLESAGLEYNPKIETTKLA